MLEMLAPLDYPRQALANLVRGGARLGSGQGELSDALGMLPGAAGLLAGGLLSPLAGAGVAGGLQGLGRLTGMQAFDAPTTQDVVGLAGGDPESTWQNIAAQAATDPLTYIGAFQGGNALARGFRGTPRPATPAPTGPLAEWAAPRQPYVPPPPGTPQSVESIYAAIEADAAAQAAREAQTAAPRPFASPAGEVGPGISMDEMTRELQGNRGVLLDMLNDSLHGATPQDRLNIAMLTDDVLYSPQLDAQIAEPADLLVMRMRQAVGEAENYAMDFMPAEATRRGTDLGDALSMAEAQMYRGGGTDQFLRIATDTLTPRRAGRMLADLKGAYPPLGEAEDLLRASEGLSEVRLGPAEAAATVRRLQGTGLPIDPALVFDQYAQALSPGEPRFNELIRRIYRLRRLGDSRATADATGEAARLLPAGRDAVQVNELLRFLGPDAIQKLALSDEQGTIGSRMFLQEQIPVLLEELSRSLGVQPGAAAAAAAARKPPVPWRVSPNADPGPAPWQI